MGLKFHALVSYKSQSGKKPFYGEINPHFREEVKGLPYLDGYMLAGVLGFRPATNLEINEGLNDSSNREIFAKAGCFHTGTFVITNPPNVPFGRFINPFHEHHLSQKETQELEKSFTKERINEWLNRWNKTSAHKIEIPDKFQGRVNTVLAFNVSLFDSFTSDIRLWQPNPLEIKEVGTYFPTSIGLDFQSDRLESRFGLPEPPPSKTNVLGLFNAFNSFIPYYGPVGRSMEITENYFYLDKGYANWGLVVIIPDTQPSWVGYPPLSVIDNRMKRTILLTGNQEQLNTVIRLINVKLMSDIGYLGLLPRDETLKFDLDTSSSGALVIKTNMGGYGFDTLVRTLNYLSEVYKDLQQTI